MEPRPSTSEGEDAIGLEQFFVDRRYELHALEHERFGVYQSLVQHLNREVLHPFMRSKVSKPRKRSKKSSQE